MAVLWRGGSPLATLGIAATQQRPRWPTPNLIGPCTSGTREGVPPSIPPDEVGEAATTSLVKPLPWGKAQRSGILWS